MFENINELLQVNLKQLYTSKTKFMIRMNFKDEYGFNLKNSKAFAEILVNKGLVLMECPKGFQCELTDLGKQIYENGGWNKYLQNAEPFSAYQNEETLNFDRKQTGKLISQRFLVASLLIIVFCIFITLMSVGIFKNK
ncbi:MAG: hypothetical protein ABI554_13150 [Flavobacterium sp.]